MNITPINKENILEKINSFAIFNYYLKPFHSSKGLAKSKNFQNPFRDKQKTPSFNIYKHKNGEYRYKDFAHSEDEGSVFDLVMRLHHCDFSEALHMINTDLALGLQGSAKPSTPKVELSAFSIWDKTHLNYWKYYGITQEHLTHFEVLPVRYYVLKKRTITPPKSTPTFAYKITADCYKIYNPLSKNFRFCWLGSKPSDYVFGFKQLPTTGDRVFLTGGEKDVIALFTKGEHAICLNSETAAVPSQLMAELKARFKEVIVLYDRDKTGIESSHKIAQAFGISRMSLPEGLLQKEGKDVADFFALGGTLQDKGITTHKFLEVAEIETSKGIQTNPHLAKLLEIETQLQTLKSAAVIRSKPLLSQNGNGIIYPRTINTIRGKAGVHKSRIAQAICSALIQKEGCKQVNIGFEKSTEQPCTVCYIDTERNLKEQFPIAIQQILHHAGYNRSENPVNFNYTSLLQTGRKDRFEALKAYLTEIRKKHEGFIVVVLDVLTDCLTDFNNIEDTLQLLDLMNMLSNDLEVSFIAVIHENPGTGDKARGHLGTEANHKATTEIRIGYEQTQNDASPSILKYSVTKLRVGKIPEPLFLKYCEETHGLIQEDQVEQNSLLKLSFVAEIQEYLSFELKGSIKRNELLERLKTKLNCCKKTIENRLQYFLDGRIALHGDKNDPKSCPKWLVKIKKGREILFAAIASLDFRELDRDGVGNRGKGKPL